MQRFPDREDEDYKNILEWIRRWVKQAKEEAHSKCFPMTGNTIPHEVAWLSFMNRLTYHSSAIRAAKARKKTSEQQGQILLCSYTRSTEC